MTSEVIDRRNEVNNDYYVKQLEEHKISVIYYLTQNTKHINNFPFIATNWDIGHLSMYAFPEIVGMEDFDVRQKWYDSQIREALSIFVDSNSGKKELLNYLFLFEL